MFDAFVMVDWSAANVPRTGRDSIWICWHDSAGERLVNPATRHQARSLLADWLAGPMAQGKRVRARNCLGPKHHRSHEQNGLAERRLIDEYMTGAQPCWKLLGAGSVGGQVLTGIPVVRALWEDPRWHDGARIWPFETGLRAQPDGALIMAEVYPSLWSVSPEAGEPKDAAQVRTVARHFAELDRDGALAELFAGDPDLAREQRRRVEAEEAWTLGVTTRARRPIPVRSAIPPRPLHAPSLTLRN